MDLLFYLIYDHFAKQIQYNMTNTALCIHSHIGPHTLPSSNAAEWPANLLSIVETVLANPIPRMNETQFQFKPTLDAAKHNWQILQQYANLGEAINAEGNSPLRYGSEFRSPSSLERIFTHHPLWPRLRNILSSGIKFPLSPLPNHIRRKDTEEAINFGNHKGATTHKQFFTQLLHKDIKHGYSLVIPIEAVLKIEGALMAPLNVVEQHTISEFGEIVQSQRLTHNQSKVFSHSDTSVNSRVITDDLQDCMYGHMIIRLVHYIVALRRKAPNKVIFMQKTDYKSAYRRAHLHWTTAIQTLTRVDDNMAQIALRATFGGAPNPNEWSVISESICDLANAILNDDKWDPDTLHSPCQKLVPEDSKEDTNIPFATGLPMIVAPPLSPYAKSDIYLDDDVTVAIDSNANTKRARAGVLLAMHIVGRPNESTPEPIPRFELPSVSKLAAEGRLEERKIVLGWLLDTRRLLIILPDHKYIAWKESILVMLADKVTSHKALETLVGRLTHLSIIMQPILHFLSRLRYLETRSTNRRKITIPEPVIEDLKLALQFLNKANQGVSMNLVTFRKPTHIYRADACPWGIGGFSIFGRAWRYEIPPHLRFRATLNMLEHVASTIGPWIDLLECNLPEFSCVLSMTDSTSSNGWLKKSNFAEKSESDIHVQCKRVLARTHAMRLLDKNIKEYTQWFPGKENDVADSLSRDFHINDSILTLFLLHFFPDQTPSNLQIRPLPSVIESWLSAWLQKMPGGSPSREIRQRSMTARGTDGKDFLHRFKSTRTPSLSNSQHPPELASSPSSHSRYAMGTLANAMIGPWRRQLVDMPWTVWHRPSGTTSGTTPDATRVANLAAFYRDSTRAIKTRIRLRNSKRQSQ